jgi:hypothetical protein
LAGNGTARWRCSRGWLIALVGVLTANAFLSAGYSKQLWLLLALGPALLAVARGMPRSAMLTPDAPPIEWTGAGFGRG